MDDKQKILFCGDVEGQFNSLFNRVKTINKKSGPFEVLFCVGNFFGVNNKEFEPYKLNEKQVPVPTYVLGPNKEDHTHLYPESETELCPNVFYLGKRGLYTDSKGLKIAYMSGISPTKGSNNEVFNFSTEDIVALRDVCVRGNSAFRGVDIFLSSQWPSNIFNLDKNSKINAVTNGSDLISWLAIHLKPRYHISGLEGIYYERPPYRTSSISDHDSADITTRFLGLARVGNVKKERWIYALSLTPINKMKITELLQKTTDETLCPYNLEELEYAVFKKKRQAQSSQYFYDTNATDVKIKEKKNKRQKISFDQSKCWFCLASPSVEKHLVITVGNLVYLTIAKGALVEEHLLICPVEHHQCTLVLPGPVLEELVQFKDALTKFYDRSGSVPVFFERNFKTSHMQIQALPIPKGAAKQLKEIFMDEAEGHGLKLEELEPLNRLDQVIPTGVPYFMVELPSGVVLYTRITSAKDFPLNFGREVLASGPVLNLLNRIDWHDCILGKESEISLVNKIRTDFEPFDFTL